MSFCTAYDHTLDAAYEGDATDPNAALAWLFDVCRLSWTPSNDAATVTSVRIVASDVTVAWNIEVIAYFESTGQRYTIALAR